MIRTTINNHEIKYTGSRPVSAAWIIEDLSGNLLKKGCSLDATKALKTAESNLHDAGWDLVKDTELKYFDCTRNAQARKHNQKRLNYIRSNTLITIKKI